MVETIKFKIVNILIKYFKHQRDRRNILRQNSIDENTHQGKTVQKKNRRTQ